MIKNPIISIIVPVYNVEEYLRTCIDSLINQTYTNIEIILVDDGSTDHSPNICDYYEEKYHNVVTIHKENGGNTSARKCGMAHAKGEYLLFVDSDDWVEPNMCEYMMECVFEYNADVVRCALITEGNEKDEVRKDRLPIKVHQSQEDLDYLYKHILYNEQKELSLTGSFCTQLMRRNIFMSVFESMSDEVQYGEDLAYSIASIFEAKTICITDEVLYHYRMRPFSITHSSNYNYYSQINALFLYLKKLFEENVYKDILLNQLVKFMDELVIRGINHRFIVPRQMLVPEYYCPLEKINAGDRVIIYGAGLVGQSYYLQLKRLCYIKVSGWTDTYYQHYEKNNIDVKSTDILKSNSYDKILIAVLQETVANNIHNYLVEKFNIPEDKIVWEKPEHIFEYYNNDRVK